MTGADRIATVCDTDPAKQALLAAAIPTAQATIDALPVPEDGSALPGSQDPFWIAVYVRQGLPAGLDAGDFDGVNVAAALGQQ